jgi:hypothetical protein
MAEFSYLAALLLLAALLGLVVGLRAGKRLSERRAWAREFQRADRLRPGWDQEYLDALKRVHER